MFYYYPTFYFIHLSPLFFILYFIPYPQQANVKQLIDANGVKILVDFLSLAHLHTSRAHVPTQRNVIEATSEMMSNIGEKEWYFGNKEKERLGPFGTNEVSIKSILGVKFHFLRGYLDLAVSAGWPKPASREKLAG